MDIEVIEERPVEMAEVKSKLEEIKKRDKELNFRANAVKEHIDGFSVIDSKKSKEIAKKINELNISRLKEKHIVKIIDIMPGNIDSLKAIFTGENITLKQEDLAKILEVIR